MLSVTRIMANFAIHVLDDLGLTISQPDIGYRFSVDSLLLAEFCRLRSRDRVLDLGTGCGVIALALASRFPSAVFTAIEVQEELAALADKNAEENNLQDRVSVIRGDLNSLKDFVAAQSMDHVVSNPPYRTPVSGRLSINSMDALARHEILTDIGRVLDAARYALRPAGRFSVVFPAERLAGLIARLVARRLEPKRIRMVHPDPNSKARICLVEACRDGGEELHVLPPLFLNTSVLN